MFKYMFYFSSSLKGFSYVRSYIQTHNKNSNHHPV